MKTGLIVPDCHIPYEDKKAFNLMLKVARGIKPDIIVTMGDLADFYSVSSFNKDPNRTALLENEVASVNKRLDELDSLGAKEKYFIEGNHCDRLTRYLSEKAPALFNSVKVSNLFELKKRKWKFVPYKNHIQVGKLFFTHDTGKSGKYAHYQSMDDFQASVVIGHTHRIGYTVVGNAQGKPHVGAMVGWLGNLDEVDYMHKIKAQRDWALGFGVFYMEPNGNVHVQPVPIVDYKAVVEGRLFKV